MLAGNPREYLGDDAIAAWTLEAERFRSARPGSLHQQPRNAGVAALRTIAEVEQAYERLMADLPSQGYAGTEFSSLEERQLNDDLAS